ncbi:MAG: universal stress protein [Gemmatimonadaceae bacterium]
MSTVITPPSVSAFVTTTSTPLALHDGPVIIAVGPNEEDHTLRAGIRVASGLARRADIVCAIDPGRIYGWEVGYGAFPRLEAGSVVAGYRERLRSAAAGAGIGSHTISVDVGPAAQVIDETATTGDAALIVMGLGRHRPVDRLIGTETALRVVQRTRVPVLAVPAAFTSPPAVAVVGVDFSDAGWHAAACALPLLAPGATLHLVHVWQPSHVDDEAHSEHDERYEHGLPARFHELTESLVLPESVTVLFEVREGHVAERLLDFAQVNHADLLVVGRHGRSWLERLRVGSVATGVLRGASCAVLVVPEPPPHARDHAPVVHGRVGKDWGRGEWTAQADAFTRRNAGKPTVLEMSESSTGAFSQERGYSLFGVIYRSPLNEVDIVLGEAHGRGRHLTNTLRGVSTMCLVRDADGTDHALRISHATGTALLALSPGRIT